MTDSEPALIIGFLTSIIMMAGAFGLAVDGRREAAIVAVATAALALVQAFLTRSRVTPVGPKVAADVVNKPVLGSMVANTAEAANVLVVPAPVAPEVVSPGAAPV